MKTRPDKKWDYYYLTKHPDITFEFISSYPDKRWDYNFLTKHPDLTFEFIKNIHIRNGITLI